MISKTTRAYEPLRRNYKFLTEGTVVSIDPSVGSRNSMPGFAVYYAGELHESGTFTLNPDDPIHERLHRLNYMVRLLYKAAEPDILVYEAIPALRYGGGNAEAHASLLKAVGAILSVSGPRDVIGLAPSSWKAMARPGYVKSDENDAIELGYVAISEARRIHAEDPTTKKLRKKQAEAPEN